MRKLKLFILLFISLVSILILTACDNSNNDQLQKIEGVTFDSAEYTYDGTEKTIIAQNIPEGITAIYKNNKATDAGEYNAEITLSGEGYETKTLIATLTINKADIIGISLAENESLKSDGEFHLPTLIGTLPTGTSTEWYFNDVRSDQGVKAVGKYAVELIISGANYNTLTINGNYQIKMDLIGLASKVIDTFDKTPNVWEILPEAFRIENYVLPGAAPTYTDFTNVNSIPQNYIGKQLNVVIGTVNKLESALGYVNTIQGALNVIVQAYNTFLSNSPDDYTVFEGSTGTFTYNIIITENVYLLNATIGTVNVSLFSNVENAEYGAKVQLTNTTVLKYTVSEGHLKIALNILGTSSTQVEFIRDIENPEIMNGYIYEYLTVAEYELISTSAYLNIGNKYTTVVGTKGDFIPTANGRNCEVYENTTGKLIGTEVSEYVEILSKSYDTLWYNLYDITGITSIKKIDEQNGYNADTIYINGNSDTIHTKNASLTDWSRRFDIEFKKVCGYVLNTESGEYESVEFEIPMLFVQESHSNTFAEDFNDKNNISVYINKTTNDKDAIHNGYHVLINIYNTIKDAVTQNDIKNYCEITE